MEGERIWTALSSMGPRTEASLAKQFVQEHCWESKLVADILNVNYLEGHQGRTDLLPLTTVRGRLLCIRILDNGPNSPRPRPNSPRPGEKSILRDRSKAESGQNFSGSWEETQR